MERNMKTAFRLALCAATAFLSSPVIADEGRFLESLQGSWSGTGTVTLKIGSSPIKVNCDFDSKARRSTFSMGGQCRGLLVVKRAVSANLRTDGKTYTGTYTGPSGRASTLSGTRKGNAINLTVRWSREINGDRVARLTIEKIGNSGLRLRTIDKNPATGTSVVTSDIRLTQ
jgi:hypothetical protein